MDAFLNQLTPEQALKCGMFTGKHSKCYAGAIGGAVSYIITPTGIGTIYSVRCGICKKELTLNEDDL